MNTAECCSPESTGHPLAALPLIDLTETARRGGLIGGAFDRQLIEALSRALYRSTRHVRLTCGYDPVGNRVQEVRNGAM